MLNNNVHISKIEHRAIFALASGLFLLRILELVFSLILPETIVAPPGVRIVYGTISWSDDKLSPIYCFFAFLFIVPLLWKIEISTLIVSLFPLSLLTFFYDYWFVDSQIRIKRILEVNPDHEFNTLDFVMIWG